MPQLKFIQIMLKTQQSSVANKPKRKRKRKKKRTKIKYTKAVSEYIRYMNIRAENCGD